MLERSRDADAFEAELERVLGSSEFARTPVLRRLLEYLASETRAGNGERLKAYQIAVDGLGRDENFDPQADSYPRVQVGRLRKMLDLYYSANGYRSGTDRARLSIPVGRYVVVLEHAPPPEDPVGQSDEATAEGRTGEPLPAVKPLPDPVTADPETQRLDTRVLAWAVAGFAVLIASFVLWQVYQPRPATRLAAGASIALGPLVHIAVEPGAATRRDALDAVAHLFEGDLQRFDNVTVTVAGRGSDPDAATPDRLRVYDLDIVAANAGGGEFAFANLRHRASQESVWSKRLPIDAADPAALEAMVAMAASEIARTRGIIAADQLHRRGRSFAPGYACLLQVEEFRYLRDPALYQPVRRCVQATLALAPREPFALQAMSMLAYASARPVPLTPSAEGRDYAERALANGRNTAIGNLAIARSALVNGNCTRMKVYGRRAIELNPLEPDYLSLVGSYMLGCGANAEAERNIKAALALDPDGTDYRWAGLILLRVLDDDPAGALEMVRRNGPERDHPHPTYLIAASLAYAAADMPDRARATWLKLTRELRLPSDTPVRQVLQHVLLQPRFVDAMVERFRVAGIEPVNAWVDKPAVAPG